VDRAVSDTGPIIHLSEIGRLKALRVAEVLIPPEVQRELTKGKVGAEINKFKFIRATSLSKRGNDIASILARRYSLSIGESEAIVLAKEKGINLIFTDDLDARDVAELEGLEPHGSVGILLRAYRGGILTRDETINSLHKLSSDSTLYITSDLVELATEAVKKHRRILRR